MLADVNGQTVCGVVMGAEIAFMRIGGGLTFRSIKHARLAWSVG